MRSIFMSYLTTPVEDPFEALRIADEAGYAGLGLRLCDPATGRASSPLVSDPATCDRFAAEMTSRGLEVPEVEARILSRGSGKQVEDAVLETACRLGKPFLIAVADQRGTIELSEICDRFAALCEQAASFGMQVGFEPIAHRAAGSLADAMTIAASDAGHGALLVLDALHVHRMGVDPSQLASIPSSRIRVFHVCDAPDIPGDLAGQIDHSAFNRLLPGEGVLPLKGYLAALPANLPISLEIPMSRLGAEVSFANRANMAMNAARSLLSNI